MTSVFILRLIHTGVYADGRPNRASIFVPDLDFGFEQQHRKTAVYVPAGGFIDLELTSRSLYSLSKGAIAGFVRTGQLRADVMVRLRDYNDNGVVTLSAGVNNVQRGGGLLRVVVDMLDAGGYVLGERVEVSGSSLIAGIYTITKVVKDTDLVGANAGRYLIEMSSVGSVIPPSIFGGVTLGLVDGKVNVELSSVGNAGGLGAGLYVAGESVLMGGVDPSSISFYPVSSAVVPNNSIFVRSDGVPCFKDAFGVVTPLGGGGPSSGGGNVFVYRPGGVVGGNVYDTWAGAYAAAVATGIPSKLIVDSSIISPAPLPAGVWDMSQIILSGTLLDFSLDELEAQDGAVLVNLFDMTDLVRLTSVSSSPVIAPTGSSTLVVERGAQIQGSGTPIIDFSNGSGQILLILGGQIDGPGVISVTSPYAVGVQMYEAASLGNDTISGDGFYSLQIASPDANVPNTQSLFTGPSSQSLSSNSLYIEFNNFFSPTFLNSQTVQDAIYELADVIGIPSFVYRPGAIPSGNVYDDWNQLYTAYLYVRNHKPVIYFDDSFGICTIPPGFYDLTGATFAGTVNKASPVLLFISDGAEVLNVYKVKDRLRIITNSTGSENMVLTTPGYFSLDNGSSIEAFGSAAAINVVDAVTFEISRGSRFVQSTGPVVRSVNPFVGLVFQLYDNSSIESNTLAGVAGVSWRVEFNSPGAFYHFDQNLLGREVIRVYNYPLGNGGASFGYYVDDFISPVVESTLNWSATGFGAASGVFVDNSLSGTGNPGIRRLSTGTTATGRGMLRQENAMSYLGTQGDSFIEWLVYIPTLSDGVDSYFLNLGFTDNTVGGQGDQAIAFRYENGNWIAYARSASVETDTIDTGIAPVDNAWTRLRIELNRNGATFFIGASPGFNNLVNVASIAAGNLPGILQRFAPIAMIQKQSGTNNRNAFVDYCHYGFNLYTTR
jgi:hypothetical protein